MVNSNLDADNGINKNTTEYDSVRLADLARRAIGTRSVAEFCADTKLSKSFVSRILNGKLVNAPTKRTLYRFAGSNAKPQNGVTLGDMLIASGYGATTEDFLISDEFEAEERERLTLAEGIQLYFSQSPAFGLNLLLDVLINKGYGKSYSIEFELGMFSLKIKPLENQYTNIVAIPAFCNDDSTITAIQVAVLTSLISSINVHQVSESLFFVMTDNMQMYQLLLNSLPVLQNMKLAVLLTNKSYNGFSKQDSIISDAHDRKPEEFPLNLCDGTRVY